MPRAEAAVTQGAPPAGHRAAMRSSPSSCRRDRRRARLFVRQTQVRSARSARSREDRQHSARARPARHRRSAGARERHRPAVGVHRRRAGAQGEGRTEIRRIQIRQADHVARGDRDHHRRQGGAARLHDPGRADLGADRRAARWRSISSPAISAKCRRKARCCPRPTSSRAARRASRRSSACSRRTRACCRRSGSGAAPTCRSRRRKRW